MSEQNDKNEIGELTEIYYKLEEIILNRISNLPSYGKDCDCADPSQFSIVSCGNIVSYCLNCGGDYELLL